MTFPRHFQNALIVASALLAISMPLVTTITPVQAADPYENFRNTEPAKPLLGSMQKPNIGKRLREGTIIPETTGRIMMLGRRWIFIPENTSGNGDRLDNASSQTATTMLSERTLVQGGLLTQTTTKSFTEKTESQRTNDHLLLGQVKLCENLMLQRIVESIRQDAADDRWTIRGTVCEFFDENRVLIRSAKRASVKTTLDNVGN